MKPVKISLFAGLMIFSACSSSVFTQADFDRAFIQGRVINFCILNDEEYPISNEAITTAIEQSSNSFWQHVHVRFHIAEQHTHFFNLEKDRGRHPFDDLNSEHIRREINKTCSNDADMVIIFSNRQGSLRNGNGKALGVTSHTREFIALYEAEARHEAVFPSGETALSQIVSHEMMHIFGLGMVHSSSLTSLLAPSIIDSRERYWDDEAIEMVLKNKFKNWR